MFKEKLEKVIEDIQSKNKDLVKFPSLLDICNPGETKFKPRSVNQSGYVLLCPFKINAKKRLIEQMEPTPMDYMGVSPFMMVVMESSSKDINPGDIVVLDHRMLRNVDENIIIINSSIAYLFPDSIIQGVDGKITEMIKETVINNNIADA